MLHVLYLVHDLSDAAVRRRVSMLRAGGAKVSVAGFRRSEEPVLALNGESVIDLGRTRDGAFAGRIASVATAACRLDGKLGALTPDVVVARNMEMLALALRIRGPAGEAPRLVYESLDIHSLLLRRNGLGTAMRWIERSLMRRVSMLITSSPAFIRDYFLPVQNVKLPILLLENKVLELPDVPTEPSSPVPTLASTLERPLRIGWFGALRCSKSLKLLAETARLMEGRVEVILRGRPAYRVFDDFDRFVDAAPYVRFEGPYRSPEDLGRIYGEIDLVWAIDFFEEGLNSRWLLPNRLYEGCRHGSVPIAAAGTETARYLGKHGIGRVLSDAEPAVLRDLLAPLLDGAVLTTAKAEVSAVDRSHFICGHADCEELVLTLARGASASMLSGQPTRKFA